MTADLSAMTDAELRGRMAEQAAIVRNRLEINALACIIKRPGECDNTQPGLTDNRLSARQSGFE